MQLIHFHETRDAHLVDKAKLALQGQECSLQIASLRRCFLPGPQGCVSHNNVSKGTGQLLDKVQFGQLVVFLCSPHKQHREGLNLAGYFGVHSVNRFL